jgi:large subunit ribosomal protein L25
MKAIFMSGSSRANVGKKDAKALRVDGLVPCVLYGGDSQIHFSVNETQFKPLLFTPDVHTVDLEIDGKSYKAVLQDIQYHNMNDSVLHADFLQLHDNKPVIIQIPVRTSGNSAGVRAGGKLVTKLRKLKVRAFLKDLPDFINIDITPLEIGQGVKVREISVPGVTLLDAQNVDVVAVTATRASRQAADDAKK